MIALILFIIFGLSFGYFATLNTLPTTVNIFGYLIPEIPVYLIVIIAFAIGLLAGGLFGTVKQFFSSFEWRKQQSTLSHAKQESVSLTKRIHQLELENAKLQTQLGQPPDEDSL